MSTAHTPALDAHHGHDDHAAAGPAMPTGIWGSVSTGFSALWVTFKNAFRPRTTVNYPFEKRTRAARYRASFALLHNEHGEEACIGCKMCENICPSGIITVVAAPKRESPVTGKKRGYHEDFTINLQACIFCELCVQVCPEDSIAMCRVQEQPGFCREDLVLTKDKLYANENNLELSWGIGSKFVEMHDSKRGLPPPPAPAPAAAPAAAPPAAPAVKEGT